MGIITTKGEIRQRTDICIQAYYSGGLDACFRCIEQHILQAKIRFPLIEDAARHLYHTLPFEHHIPLCNAISAGQYIGGNVLIGIILQQRLSACFDECIEKTKEYLIAGNQWYVCDIIGERVIGHALLTMPDTTLPVLHDFALHPNTWIVRCIGVAAHYAIKKGLAKSYVHQVFCLLLTLAHATDFHTRKGIGWAAKTTAKFHPDIIQANKSTMAAMPNIGTWFTRKISIGLGRADKYSSRYTE